MLACAGISLIGMVVTLSCVADIVEQDDEKNESDSSVPMRVVISEPSLLDYFDTI